MIRIEVCEELNDKEDINKGGALHPPLKPLRTHCPLFDQSKDYFFNLIIYLTKASPFLSMAYSTVSLAPVEEVLRSVS